jgi:SsrA-binding protein
MSQNRKSDPNNKVAAENRKARFSYEVLDTVETGLVLTGTEVKSGILRFGGGWGTVAHQFLPA